MSDPKEILAQLRIIEDMATESSVKELSKAMQDYIKSTDKTQTGFKAEQEDKS